MRILVTGRLGVVGTPLVRELKKRRHEVWVCNLMHSDVPNYIRCDMGRFRQVQGGFY